MIKLKRKSGHETFSIDYLNTTETNQFEYVSEIKFDDSVRGNSQIKLSTGFEVNYWRHNGPSEIKIHILGNLKKSSRKTPRLLSIKKDKKISFIKSVFKEALQSSNDWSIKHIDIELIELDLSHRSIENAKEELLLLFQLLLSNIEYTKTEPLDPPDTLVPRVQVI